MNLDERGNTLLTNDDGGFVFWARLEDSKYQEIARNPGNYPALDTAVVNLSEEQLAAHIKEHCGGWYVRKLNVAGVDVDRNNEIIGDEE